MQEMKILKPRRLTEKSLIVINKLDRTKKGTSVLLLSRMLGEIWFAASLTRHPCYQNLKGGKNLDRCLAVLIIEKGEQEDAGNIEGWESL